MEWIFNPLFLSSLFLGITILMVMSELLNPTVAALVGAGLTISLGLLDQTEAVQGIDFNTLALLVGMMMIVGIAEPSGVFQYVAIKSAKLVKARPAGILFVLQIVTAFFSAFCDGDFADYPGRGDDRARA
jgi:Na+/H+ antiporter NhaD/arsenite permease-like protein